MNSSRPNPTTPKVPDQSHRIAPSAARRKRLLVRAVPLMLISAAAFGGGLVVASGSSERDAVARFGAAWERQDFAAMYAELSPSAKATYDATAFEQAYSDANETATVTSLGVGEARGPLNQPGPSIVALPVSMGTSSFGPVDGEIAMPVSHGAIDWDPELVFPGLTAGDELKRKTELPKRAPILAADRSPIAEGPVTSRTTNGAGGIIAGEVGTLDKDQTEQEAELEARGFPPGSPTGTSGLELAFDSVLAGTPGGKLKAVGGGGGRTLASSKPVDGTPVRTTIDPGLQEATAAALGDTFGGAAVLDAKNGHVLALAGIAFSGPQPPGSTFKIITVTGALQAGVTKLDEEFPVQSSAVVGGRDIANAHDELCGGNLVQSFAESCNSVFAPLGAKLGGPKLVQTAELFGFNSPPSLYNADALAAVNPLQSSIPDSLPNDLEAGVSAIGQGEVLATPLEMASAAQTIANDGVRSPTSLVRDPVLSGDYPDVKVTTPKIAKEVKQMMIEVVNSGTGIAAAIPGVTVAGKTGTAELGTSSTSATPQDGVGEVAPEQDVDAWFTAFAPADKPKLAVAVLVVNAPGDGGTVAAPIARSIMEAGL